ncbi:methylene-tetrahydromethanopterin dehydrogenase N-terminal domain-containing protein [Schlesneria sp. DSM 10557]|uniref:methylene-tetrahydromethanopterin dehydrogenase N-terminal domain-containing protein n=1 Tax=Schlesneria sp. DSM 10557 TaxID=3044399 RepID=UPI0035C85675
MPSSFDRVVAVDAGVDELFSYGGVTPDNVETLVHGAIFTRKPSDLVNTAIFVGGSNVAAGERSSKPSRSLCSVHSRSRS